MIREDVSAGPLYLAPVSQGPTGGQLEAFVIWWVVLSGVTRKEDIRKPGKENSNSHGARPVY